MGEGWGQKREGQSEGVGSPESDLEHSLEISARKGLKLPQTAETCWKQATEAPPSVVGVEKKREEEAGPGGPCHPLTWSWAHSRDPAWPDGQDLEGLGWF